MMIRKLMASSAVLALISAGALTASAAETQTTTPPALQEDMTAAPAATEAAATETEGVLTPEQPTFASVFIGRSVYSSTDPESDNIGDVNDLIVAEDGRITHAIVGVGGFLGLGEKDVAVPFDELEVVQQDGDIRLIYSATREQLEAAPAVDRTAYDPIARYAEEQAAQVDSNSSLAPLTPDASAPADQTATIVPKTEEPADMTAAPADEATIAETSPDEISPEENMAATDDSSATPAPAEEPVGDMASTESAPADATAAPAEETAAAETAAPAEVIASAEETVAPAEEIASAAETAPVDGTAVAPDDQEIAAAGANTAGSDAAAPVGTDGQFLTYNADHIRASSLIGMSVYGSGDESIGEVSDVVLQADGTTRAALIDVGGFLGIGEKTVAVPFQDLKFSEVMDPAATDGTPITQVTIAWTRDQLDQQPAYEAPEEQAAAAPSPDATQPSDPAATDDIVTGSVGSSDDYSAVTQDLTATELMGLTVYGPDDSTVGEVGDLVFDETGNIEAVVIDVGGFLGIDEKPVAIGFDNLKVRTDESGSLTAMVDMSKEQFDSAPTYVGTGTGDTSAIVQ